MPRLSPKETFSLPKEKAVSYSSSVPGPHCLASLIPGRGLHVLCSPESKEKQFHSPSLFLVLNKKE